ncbi:MAG: arginine--tRNA ligase [Lachnospiraceae bacterium]|nr:arginine--tRNA ligase [Lachnospiraceae bacterium]MBR5738373.1 arginine--tRNA ligase [Lachnospiraceae bacterium]
MLLSKVLNDVMAEAFEHAGYDPSFAKVTVSNRPDLCDYQCNGALALARTAHQPPIAIAEKVAACLNGNDVFSEVSAVKPGFINLKVSTAFLARFAASMGTLERFGAEKAETPKTILIDYGGPNVAKPLHIGHLRSAIIGESMKRILAFQGNRVIGDIHLGDWGLQFGLIIEELKDRKPDLPYFDPEFSGEYPEEAPFTLSELEEIYPAASARSKTDEEFLRRAHEATYRLQKNDPAILALWKHIMKLSIADEKRLYDRLNVHFELWKGESDAGPLVPEVVKIVKEKGLARVSEGALIVDVQEEGDTREIPPCIILKSDGAALYQTTDLATLIMRMREFHPDELIYITDKRQELHFTQVFRTAKKAGIVEPETVLKHIGYGTMNGKDGKPFKTRTGGVMRLEVLIAEIEDAVREKMKDRYEASALSESIVSEVALSAIKYGDLSNQARKDYNFDIDRFASFEGNTGPYILYNIVRIKSILSKAGEPVRTDADFTHLPLEASGMKTLLTKLNGFADMIEEATAELAPHKICQYIHELCDAFSSFYHDTPILKEEDPAVRGDLLSLLSLIQRVLETCIDLLGFSAPERM